MVPHRVGRTIRIPATDRCHDVRVLAQGPGRDGRVVGEPEQVDVGVQSRERLADESVAAPGRDGVVEVGIQLGEPGIATLTARSIISGSMALAMPFSWPSSVTETFSAALRAAAGSRSSRISTNPSNCSLVILGATRYPAMW